MDVEGAELGILNASLMPLLQQRRIRYLIMEATPGFWNSSLLGETHSLRFGAQLAYAISSFGYSLQSRPIVKRCQRASGPYGDKACWLWEPRAIADYVTKLTTAEDIMFERIEREFVRRRTDAASPVWDQYDAWCGAHSYRLKLRASG